jgi:hypothetical protein
VHVVCGEYSAELNRLRAEAGGPRGAKVAEIDRLKRHHARLMDAFLREHQASR